MSEQESTTTAFPEVPGFRILSQIGRGGMGEVYLAQQLSLKRSVAIKFLTSDFKNGDRAERLERFRREAELMAQVSHPNVLNVLDVGTAHDRAYIIMEYVAGGDLRKRMEPGRPLPISQTRNILKPVAEALSTLHRPGILHRDLKPENILINDEDQPKVTDFGISSLDTEIGDLTRPEQTFGTIGYAAPEQQHRLPVDERTDQYSLAAIAYEMLTGKRPMGIIKPPSHHNRQLDARIDEVISRGLAEDPDERYPSVKDFADELDIALARVCTRRARGRTLIVAAVISLLIAVGLVWSSGFFPAPESGMPQRHGTMGEKLEHLRQVDKQLKGKAAIVTTQSTLEEQAAQNDDNQQPAELTHWLNLTSGVRHNKDCRHFRDTKQGRMCRADEGTACKHCGG